MLVSVQSIAARHFVQRTDFVRNNNRTSEMYIAAVSHCSVRKNRFANVHNTMDEMYILFAIRKRRQQRGTLYARQRAEIHHRHAHPVRRARFPNARGCYLRRTQHPVQRCA